MSTTLGCKGLEIIKSEFVGKDSIPLVINAFKMFSLYILYNQRNQQMKKQLFHLTFDLI